MDVIVSGKNLYFTYNKGKTNEFQALKNISFDIYEKELVIIFGPSGCGKSSLLNVIAGLELPDEGQIEVLGRDLMNLKKNDFAMFHRNEIGMVYQQYNLITSLSVLDNVALPQIFVNVGKRKREKWSKSLLDRFGILEHADKIPTELSGGQQQRIGIARAIANNPQIILADEPVGNLDSISAENVIEILCELNEDEKKTVIMVTHNPENLYIADRIIYMKDGIITKEVVNKNKKKKKDINEASLQSKSPTATISDLMRSYKGLSPEQINILIMPYKAKIFTHHFITSRSMEESSTFEKVVQRRLLGVISQEEFIDVLNRPFREGGVGFDIRTAKKISKRIGRLIRIAYFIYKDRRQRKDKDGKHVLITDDEKTDRVLKYILDTCYHEYVDNLSDTQIERLRNAVYNRLTSSIQKIQFYDYLDKPFADGGVGLNSKTANSMTEEIELILILGFGIVQTGSTPDIKLPEKQTDEDDLSITEKDKEDQSSDLKNEELKNNEGKKSDDKDIDSNKKDAEKESQTGNKKDKKEKEKYSEPFKAKNFYNPKITFGGGGFVGTDKKEERNKSDKSELEEAAEKIKQKIIENNKNYN